MRFVSLTKKKEKKRKREKYIYTEERKNYKVQTLKFLL